MCQPARKPPVVPLLIPNANAIVKRIPRSACDFVAHTVPRKNEKTRTADLAERIQPAHKAAFEIVVGRIEFGLEYAFRHWNVPGWHGRRTLKISR